MTGRPEYKVNDTDYEIVKALCLFGAPQTTIANYIGIATKTLCKHYHELLANCKEDKNGAMEMSLYRKGLQGSVEAQKFWLSSHQKDLYGVTGARDSNLDAKELLREIADQLPD